MLKRVGNCLLKKEHQRDLGKCETQKCTEKIMKENNKLEAYHRWMKANRMDVPGDYQDDPTWKLWSSAWHTGYSKGYNSADNKNKKKTRTPMRYWDMEKLFEGCKTGREFGLKVEEWHGIK